MGGGLYCLPKALAIFDMAGEVADSRIEDIVQCILSEEEVAYDA